MFFGLDKGIFKNKKKTDSVLLLRVELLFFKILWQMATHADLTCLGTDEVPTATTEASIFHQTDQIFLETKK